MIGQSLIEIPTLEDVLIDHGFQLREIPLYTRTLIEVTKNVNVDNVPVPVYVTTYDINREDEAIEILKNACDLNLYGILHDDVTFRAQKMVNHELLSALKEYEKFYERKEKNMLNDSRC